MAQIHRATRVVAMLEGKRVAERVHAFFERALEKRVVVGRLVCEFRSKPECRDDAYAVGVARIAVDERVRGLIQIARDDAEQKPVARRVRREKTIEDRVEEELTAREVGLRR